MKKIKLEWIFQRVMVELGLNGSRHNNVLGPIHLFLKLMLYLSCFKLFQLDSRVAGKAE